MVQTPWVRARLEAVQALWNHSAEARSWMDGYDFRQMVAQPAWFGSTGFSGYAGAGQAVPGIIMHELSHSFWGAFPVAGRPELTGEQLEDGTLKVVAAYREDLAEFMRQPPDRFEPLRDRFRNMPNLSTGGYPDLHHFGEADMISMTGGDLSLVPPILRKYLDPIYGDAGIGGRDFTDWEGAIRWWNGLTDDERQTAGAVFGLQHFPLDRYRNLRPFSGTTSTLPPALAEVLGSEEEQRIVDFAEQLEEVKEAEGAATDAAGVNRGFDFWRSYLNEIRDLHRKHPTVLRQHPSEEARQIGAAFDFYLEIEALPADQQAGQYRTRQGQPFVADFPFLLKTRAIVELFSADATRAKAGEEVGGIVAGYADVLAAYAKVADEVVAAARRSPIEGAERLEAFLNSLSDDDMRSSLGTVLDLMHEEDQPATATAMRNLSVMAIARLLELRPEIARNGNIPPEDLLAAVNVAATVPGDLFVAGIARLTDHTSGNFVIDRPYDERVYALLDLGAGRDPALVRRVFVETGLQLYPWVRDHTRTSTQVFKRDPAAAAELILEAADLRHPAPMIMQALINGDPWIGAEVAVAADGLDPEIVARTLNQFVYDPYWSGLRAGPRGDLSADARFLSELVRLKGEDWTLRRIGQGVTIYRSAISRGELEAEYTTRHADLLRWMLTIIPPGEPAAVMLQKIAAVVPL